MDQKGNNSIMLLFIRYKWGGSFLSGEPWFIVEICFVSVLVKSVCFFFSSYKPKVGCGNASKLNIGQIARWGWKSTGQRAVRGGKWRRPRLKCLCIIYK